jgi:hypothetical protein
MRPSCVEDHVRAILVIVAVCAGELVAHAMPPPPPPGPDEIFQRVVSAAWQDMEACNKEPKLVGEVTVRRTGRTWRLDPSQSLGKAGTHVAACVRDALAKHLARDFHGTGQYHTHRIGVTVPVLPPAAKVIAAWRRGARDELRKLLPADHSLTSTL